MSFAPLPGRTGRIAYRHNDGALWGFETWRCSTGRDGMRTLSTHCELEFQGEHIVRDALQSVHPDWSPHDATVRIQRNGAFAGSGWFRFTEAEAEGEVLTAEAKRVSERLPLPPGRLRGFGTHGLQADAWLAAAFPFEQGPGHRHFWPLNLLHSLHHLGATGPTLATTRSGLEFVGEDEVTVPAGTFACRRVRFVGFTNDHPPYDMWITAEPEPVYVKGVVEGYLASVFELTALESA